MLRCEKQSWFTIVKQNHAIANVLVQEASLSSKQSMKMNEHHILLQRPANMFLVSIPKCEGGQVQLNEFIRFSQEPPL
jgi:hypothetical protein